MSSQNGGQGTVANGQEGWLDQFAGYLEVERNYSSHTIRAYLNDLRQLIGSDLSQMAPEETVLINNAVMAPSSDSAIPSEIKEVIEDISSSGASGATSGWLEAEGLRTYIRQIQEQYSRPTVARKISAIRSFYRYLRREQLIEEDPSKQVRGPKLTRRLPNCLDKEEIVKLLMSHQIQTLYSVYVTAP